MPLTSFTFEHPLPLIAATLLALTAVALIWARRIELDRIGRALLVAGLIVMALAAGGVTWNRPLEREVLVMVDLSPSTRGARYRDGAFLQNRIEQLVGKARYRVVAFADQPRPLALPAQQLGDVPSDVTVFDPPAADAILLFADGNFDLPAILPRTFIVIDPLLIEPADVAVRNLELRDRTAAASVSNRTAEDRALARFPATRPIALPPGSQVVSWQIPAETARASAKIDGRDAWPENDALEILAPPPPRTERWWIGSGAPGTWKAMTPAELPLEPAAYLAPSIIVLENVPAAAIDAPRLQLLQQYVRDLGGALLILGGDTAFAAGGYAGTTLEELSPLASTPPAPTLHWTLLADASGSMSQAEGPSTRFELARDALLGVLRALPPDDPVSVGSFSDSLRWWSQGRSARETRQMRLPPPGIGPNGPTNLGPALAQLIANADAALPRELLLLTDANVELPELAALRTGLRQKRIRLHVLVIAGDDARGLAALRQLAADSGGTLLSELEPRRWSEAARRLFQQAAPTHLSRDPARVRFAGELSPLSQREIPLHNRTWAKKDAMPLTAPNDAGPRAARWTVGAGGQVLAAAFAPSAAELDAMVRLIDRPPRDPRLQVTWETGQKLGVRVDAADGQRPLNGLPLKLELASTGDSAPPAVVDIPQTAPGRYERGIAAPRRASIAAVKHGGRLVERIALAGRYAPEFDRIGNNMDTLRELARRSGGAIVPPTQVTPIDFAWPTRPVPLTPWLTTLAAGLLAGAVLRWRKS